MSICVYARTKVQYQLCKQTSDNPEQWHMNWLFSHQSRFIANYCGHYSIDEYSSTNNRPSLVKVAMTLHYMYLYLCICNAHVSVIMFCIYSHLTFFVVSFSCNLSSFQRITILIVCQLIFNMGSIVLCALAIVFTVQQVCVLRLVILVSRESLQLETVVTIHLIVT